MNAIYQNQPLDPQGRQNRRLNGGKTVMRLGIFIALFSAFFASPGFAQAANNTLNNRVIVGYQGWFGAVGDGSAQNSFVHWQNTKSDGRTIPAIDVWPKMGEYTNTYTKSGWTLRNGSAARVFSAYDLSTVNVHFKWMQDFGIDGAGVGRFTHLLSNTNAKAFRDRVLRNAATASVTYGRVFYIEYDISEEGNNNATTNVNGNVFDRIKADMDYWFGSSGFTTAQKSRYVTIGGKPVVRIFGVGSPRNQKSDGTYIFSAAQAAAKLDTLNNTYTVMLGVNKDWRTLSTGSNIRSDWTGNDTQRNAARNVWKQAQYMQGWVINGFTTTSGADSYYRGTLGDDITWGKAQNPVVNVMPIIWNGFSWRNLKDGTVAANQVPRGDGTFYWNNGYEAVKALKDKAAPVKCIYVAMFDEIDEGTSIMKVETVLNNTPTESSFSRLSNGSAATFITNVGGPNNQPDYFLWLTQRIRANLVSTSAPSEPLPVR